MTSSTNRTDADAETDVDISLFAVANVLLRRWRLVIGLPFFAAVVTAIISLIVPEIYRSTAMFTPEPGTTSTSVPSGLAGIASQFGIGIGGGRAQSPQFYAALLKSRTIFDELLRSEFPDPLSTRAGQTTTLLELLEVEGESETARLEKARRRLNKLVQVSVNDLTSIVRLSVETKYPETSAAVADRLLQLLNQYNTDIRQSSARISRQFVESRLTESEHELAAAEDELRTFLQRNRQWQGSPDLEFRHGRLQRQVTIRTEVYTSLRRQYEESRVAEVNDTPVITVIDAAAIPDERARPRRTLNVLLAGAIGGVTSMFLAFTLAFLDKAKTEEEEAASEFHDHLRRIKGELLGPLARG